MFYRYIALRVSVHLAERAKDREKIIELQVNVRQRDVEIARLRKALERIEAGAILANILTEKATYEGIVQGLREEAREALEGK